MSRDIIIVEMGIDICLNCPYPECVGTDTNLCDLIKKEVKRVKKKIESEENAKEKIVLENIQSLVNDDPLTFPQLCELQGYEYKYLQSLMKRGKLKVKRKMSKYPRKNKIFVTGVNI